MAHKPDRFQSCFAVCGGNETTPGFRKPDAGSFRSLCLFIATATGCFTALNALVCYRCRAAWIACLRCWCCGCCHWSHCRCGLWCWWRCWRWRHRCIGSRSIGCWSGWIGWRRCCGIGGSRCCACIGWRRRGHLSDCRGSHHQGSCKHKAFHGSSPLNLCDTKGTASLHDDASESKSHGHQMFETPKRCMLPKRSQRRPSASRA